MQHYVQDLKCTPHTSTDRKYFLKPTMKIVVMSLVMSCIDIAKLGYDFCASLV